MALRRCLRRSGQLLPPPSSLVSSCDRFGKNFPLLFQVEKAISRLIVGDFFSEMVSRQPPGVLLSLFSLFACY